MKTLWIALAVLVLSVPLAAEPFKLAGTEILKPFEPLMAKVLKSAGYDASFVYLPQGRLVSEETNRLYDGAWFLSEIAIGMLPGMETVPVPLYQNELVAVTIRPEIKITSSADLAAYSVGVERFNRTQALAAQGAGELIEAIDNAAQFRMLAAGRFDVLIIARAVVPSLAKEAGLTRYYVQEPALLTIPLYLAVTARASSLGPKLTPFFQKVVDDGSWAKGIRAILAKMNQ